ncbi:MAG TPA: hypothetical protein PLD84_03530 [Chitinophagales bacterium]|nr:hypothetical protein [Chitinophagales bacterium]
MTFTRIEILVAVLLLMSSSAFAGGPWTQNKKGGYTQLSFSTISANRLYNNNGESYQLYRTVTDNTLQAYFEYGLTGNLTLLGNIPVKFVATGDDTFNPDTTLIHIPFPAGNLTALGNISVALKYKLIDQGWKLSAQLRTDANTSSAEVTTGLQTGYDCWSYQPSLLAGFSKNAWYGYVSAGITLRSGHYSESFNATVESGYGFFKQKTYVIIVLDLDKSFLNDSTQRQDYLRTGLYVNNQEYFSYGLKINQSIGQHWNVNGSLLGGAYGNLVAKAPAYNLGVAFKW